jgi:hypothetical protein
MKKKILEVLLGLGTFVAFQAAGQQCQYVTLKSGNYPLQTNQVITLVGYDWYNRPTVTGGFPDGTQTTISPVTVENGTFGVTGSTTSPSYVSYYPGNYYTSTPLASQIFTGLTNISITPGPGGSTASATFKIETFSTGNVVSNYVQADAIVIPSSATGNVQIILESSPDLVNWTAANPGIYGSSAGTNRFFRVRAAVTP